MPASVRRQPASDKACSGRPEKVEVDVGDARRAHRDEDPMDLVASGVGDRQEVGCPGAPVVRWAMNGAYAPSCPRSSSRPIDVGSESEDREERANRTAV